MNDENLNESEKIEDSSFSPKEESKKGSIKKESFSDNLLEKFGFKKRKKTWIIGVAISVVISFIFLLLIVIILLSPVLLVDSIVGTIKNVPKNIFQVLKNGFFSNCWHTDGICNEREKKSFFEEIEDVSLFYKDNLSVELNVELLTSTLIYGTQDVAKKIAELYEKEIGKTEDIANVVGSKLNYEKLEKFTRPLSTQLVKASILYSEPDEVETCDDNGKNCKKAYVCHVGKKASSITAANNAAKAEIDGMTEEIKDNREIRISNWQNKVVPSRIEIGEENGKEGHYPHGVCYQISYYEDQASFLEYIKNYYIPSQRYEKFPYEELSEEEKKEVNRATIEVEDVGKASYELIREDRYRDSKYIKGATSMPFPLGSGESWKDKITSHYGARKDPITGVSSYHNGIDIALPLGTHVYSVADGTVLIATYSAGYGFYVKIGHDLNEDGQYDYYTLYAHMQSYRVKVGDTVLNGETIGYSGSTGKSTGPHLHFEVRNKDDQREDPEPYLNGIYEKNSILNSNTVAILPLTNEQANIYATNLLSQINKAGFHTRAGTVSAAKYLATTFPGLPYFWGGKSSGISINTKWGTPQEVTAPGLNTQPQGTIHPFGMDCSGFIHWALQNAGFNIGIMTANSYRDKFKAYEVNLTSDQIKPGDLIWNDGHIGIVVGTSAETITVAHESGSLKGLVIEDFRRATTPRSRFQKVLLMDAYYNDASNWRV